ncbi:MAG: UDP-3-O-(3-hydroxymyristoyl)glucosamine N-acyltransferase [Xanthomonadales bacterium]|nr:UDP-3-O-(3-hydroxymyristoyl)glucosamine N-acyltransferase [Xanthomonadales bacterium]
MPRLGDIAATLGLDIDGDPAIDVCGVATLSSAGPGHLAFLANPRYRLQLRKCAAAALIIHPDERAGWSGAALLSPNPYADFARAAALFSSEPDWPAGRHRSAVIADDAVIDPGAHIGAHVSIGARSRVEHGAVIGPGCVIGEDCVVGRDSRLVSRVSLVCRVRIGARVIVHPGAVLGADGFGLAMHEGRWIKVPQQGGVVIGDDCEIGANTCIDRGALDDTVLGEDVRLDNQIQIGHNVAIGAHTAMAGCCAVAGSAKIGSYCLIAGGVGVAGHIEIADRVTVTAMSLVTRSIREPGTYSSGTPLMRNAQWRRSAVGFKRLARNHEENAVSSGRNTRNPEE